jgi:GT2 family glycosyltransferase
MTYLLFPDVRESRRRMTTRPALSVIVLAYKNEPTVVQAVDSLRSQAPADELEVIVVASGGDGSASLVRQHNRDVYVIESAAPLLPGAARNRGVERAAGKLIAFLAGDCIAQAGWVENRIAAHCSGFAAVASCVTNAGPSTPWSWAACYFLYSSRLCGQPPRLLTALTPQAHGMSFDREVLKRLGPFPEDVRIGEDTEMARRVFTAGIPVWLEPSICSGHFGPHTTIAMIKDQADRGARRRMAEPPRWTDASRPRVLLYVVRAALRRLVTTVRRVAALGSVHRARLVACFPWLLAASFAYHWGWAKEELAAAGEGS